MAGYKTRIIQIIYLIQVSKIKLYECETLLKCLLQNILASLDVSTTIQYTGMVRNTKKQLAHSHNQTSALAYHVPGTRWCSLVTSVYSTTQNRLYYHQNNGSEKICTLPILQTYIDIYMY